MPDPLDYVDREVTGWSFSLVFWQSDRLYEEFPFGLKDVSLTLIYKLVVNDSKQSSIRVCLTQDHCYAQSAILMI